MEEIENIANWSSVQCFTVFRMHIASIMLWLHETRRLTVSIVRGMAAASGQNDVIAKKSLVQLHTPITIRQEQVRKGFAIISNGRLPISIGVKESISFL